MIGHKQIPSRSGGVEIVVEKLSEHLMKRGIQIDIYNRRMPEGEQIREYKGMRMYYSFTVHRKNLDAIIAAFFSTLRALTRGYDILHYHAEGSCLMLWLPHLFHKKIAVTIHGLDWRRAKWSRFASKMLLVGEKFAVKYADQIIVLSKDVQRYFMEQYGRRTNYIPNGVDPMPKRRPNLIRKKFGLGKEGYILFLARIVPEKGLHYLINAYKNIDTEKKLVVAGNCPYAQEYGRQILELAGNSEKIIFTGFVEGELLEELFSNAAVYVLPSEIEGMPISLLEAMSYGRCCLVSDIPENLNVAEGCVESFCTGNTDDLQRHLEELLRDPEKCCRLGEKAADYVGRCYNWEMVAERTVEVYESK